MSSISTGLPQVRVRTFSARLPSLHHEDTLGVLGFVGVGQLTHSGRLTKVRLRLGNRFDLDFLQIPHWQHPIPEVQGGK